MEQTESLYSEILMKHPVEEGSLIPLLQEIQAKMKYISPESVEEISEYLGITENHIYGVASFYSQFRFTEPGDHAISVCLGTACHVSGGECTADKKFELERVACLGCCALAPVVKIDDNIYGKVNLVKLKDIFNTYE